ncbi:MAG: flavin reductase [Firmicutes bacterium]|nr:flavin reductase [Bacillota bacterium]
MKRDINVFEYANEIVKAIGKGVLLNTCADDRFNTMTIGWGSLGIEWNKPVFTVYVRESRFTTQLLRKNKAFTISAPMGEYDRTVLGQAGSLTGWKIDKAKDLAITLEEPAANGVPGIREFPLTIECRVIYKKEQPIKEIGIEGIEQRMYPQDEPNPYAGRNNSPHTEYIGEIVAAYIIED